MSILSLLVARPLYTCCALFVLLMQPVCANDAQPEGKQASHSMEYETAPPSSEFMCLAKGIYFEAGIRYNTKNFTDQRVIAGVILGRLHDARHRFGRTICQVINQTHIVKGKVRHEFSWVDDKNSNNPRPGFKWDVAKKIAIESLNKSWQDVVQFSNNAKFFHARTIHPGWKRPIALATEYHIYYR